MDKLIEGDTVWLIPWKAVATVVAPWNCLHSQQQIGLLVLRHKQGTSYWYVTTLGKTLQGELVIAPVPASFMPPGRELAKPPSPTLEANKLITMEADRVVTLILQLQKNLQDIEELQGKLAEQAKEITYLRNQAVDANVYSQTLHRHITLIGSKLEELRQQQQAEKKRMEVFAAQKGHKHAARGKRRIRRRWAAEGTG